MTILQTHFKVYESRHILLQTRGPGCEVTPPLEASPRELLYKLEH